MAQEIVIVGDDGTEHVFPEGFDPKKAAAIVRGGTAGPPPPGGGMAGFGNAMLASRPDQVVPGAQARTDALTMAPSFGGAVGGMMGGIPGAAVGGALGSAVQQFANQPTPPAGPAPPVQDPHFFSPRMNPAQMAPGPNVGTMALEGGIQGTGEGAGRLIAGAAKPVGRWAMDRALNLTDRLATEFPEMGQALIDKGITVSRGGLSDARGFLRTAKAQANNVLHEIDASGQRIPLSAATDRLSGLVDDLPATGDPNGNLSRLATVERQMTGGHAPDFSGTEADALKGGLQREARQLYTAANGPNGRPALNIQSGAKGAMASGLNEAIDQTGEAVGAPGYRAANQEAQQMIGAVRGIRRATRPGMTGVLHAAGTPAIGATIGGALGYESGHPGVGAAMGAAAGTPQGLSLMARGLAGPTGQQIIRQLPRLALTPSMRAALLAQLNGGSQ